MGDRNDEPLACFLCSQLLTLEELYSKSSDLGDQGLYAFVAVEPPHWVYIGRSTNLRSRVRAERRLRQHHSHVLVFNFPGTTLTLEVLKEMEKRTLRTADRRWLWARWRNKMDLFVRGADRYLAAGSGDVEAIISRLLSEVEGFVTAQPQFDPRASNRLPPTHILGDCRDEVHGFGRETATGRFLVYADSRLTSSLVTAKQLLSHPGPHVQRAADLYRRGLITRLSRTHTRATGLFFVRDHEVSSSIEAAQLLMGRPCESDPWRLATREEIDRFFVIEGTHRRWQWINDRRRAASPEAGPYVNVLRPAPAGIPGSGSWAGQAFQLVSANP